MSRLQAAMLVFEMSWSYKVSRWSLIYRHAVYSSQNSLILRLSQTIPELCSRCVSEDRAQVEFYASLNRVHARSTIYVQRSPAEIHTAVQGNPCGRNISHLRACCRPALQYYSETFLSLPCQSRKENYGAQFKILLQLF